MKRTGCLPKCKYDIYEFEVAADKDVDWKTNWMSSFYLMPNSGEFKHYVEKYEFGSSQLLADFGSYLGLYLGWSLLTISRDIPAGLRWLRDMCKTWINKCKPNDKENGNDNLITTF